ncbi:MAG: dual specificity protein phosphatase family protein [Anaerolineales bacterium]|nr:dual specificity protein phosphatase family protein [Anaerolineales bacterium]
MVKENSRYNFVKVGNGRIALNHRPRGVDFSHLRKIGCTHIVTLLKESERAETYGNMAKNAGLNWIWLPVPNGDYPRGEVHDRLIQTMPQLSEILDEGGSILIHCSAGIHRTGTVAYGLLRWRGVEGDEAMRLIATIRKETAEGMLEKRRRWGDENAGQVVQQDKSWAHSVKEFVNQLKTRLFRSR